MRFYKQTWMNGYTHVAHLWSSNGTLLATASFTNETSFGWQQISFASPVAISANTVYVISFSTGGGYFGVTTNYFGKQRRDQTGRSRGKAWRNGRHHHGRRRRLPRRQRNVPERQRFGHELLGRRRLLARDQWLERAKERDDDGAARGHAIAPLGPARAASQAALKPGTRPRRGGHNRDVPPGRAPGRDGLGLLLEGTLGF